MQKKIVLGLTVCVGLGVSCGKSKSSSTSTAAAATTAVANALTTVPDMMTGALAIIPNMKPATALVGGWAAEDKSTYRNDLAFEVLMRFMGDDAEAVLQLGNENMRNNLDNAKIFYTVATSAVGTSSVTAYKHTLTVDIEEKAASAATVSPFSFSATPYTGYQKVRKLSVPDHPGTDFYGASNLSTDKAYLGGSSQSSASSSEGAGTGSTTISGDFNNTSKALNLDYASNVAYDSGAAFIIRMNFVGNVDSNDFAMKMTLRSGSKPNSMGGAGGFAMVSKGITKIPEAGAAANWVTVKARDCVDSSAANAATGYDAKACLGTATTKYFCFDASTTLDDFATFVKSGNQQGSGYTNTSKIMWTTDYTTFTGTCLTNATALKDVTYFEADETDVPKATTTYYSTWGYE